MAVAALSKVKLYRRVHLRAIESERAKVIHQRKKRKLMEAKRALKRAG